MRIAFLAVAGLALAQSVQAGPMDFIAKLKAETAKIEQAITNKTEAALDAVVSKKTELVSEGVNIVGDKVEQADTFKYDKVSKITGKYYCSPGYSTAAAHRRALLQQASQCKPCGIDYYCPGGFQTLADPSRIACPAGTTTDGLTTASSRSQCLIECTPGYYAADNVYGPCEQCGYAFYCVGGVQRSLATDRIACPTGTNTTTPTASTSTDCVTPPP